MDNQHGMYLFLSQDDVQVLKRALGTRFERVKKNFCQGNTGIGM